jgi:hypothetical protein
LESQTPILNTQYPIPNTQPPTSNLQLSVCLFAFLFSIYLLTFSGCYHSSDEKAMLAATDSLARRGAWDIDLLSWMGEQQGSFGPDGHLYSRKGIGTTLAALPLYWLALQSQRIGNVQAAMLTNGVVTALTGVLVFLFLRRLRYGERVSLLTALAFGLTTMAWPYARYLFSEPLAGLGLMTCAYFLLRYHDEGDGASLLLAGAGLGVSLLARLNNAIVAPLLGLLLLVYLHRHYGRAWQAYVAPILLFSLPVLAALAVTGWYNWLRFGSPLTTGYLAEERFATPFFEGLYGLTFSPGKGLFWYNPIFFVTLAAWPAFFRRHRTEALLAAAIVLSNIAFYAPWYLWWAGHAWGPRFLVTILPFAMLPLAPALEAARKRKWLAVGLAALSLVSIAVQVLGVAVDFNLYLEDIHAELGLYHPATLFNPAYSPLLRQIAYVHPENLDLAWAQKIAAGSNKQASLALIGGLALVLLAELALWASWQGRLGRALAIGLPVVLAVGVGTLLVFYAPAGDVATAAQALATMERPGETAVLANWLLTEPWQDAYDGHLRVQGTGAGPVSEPKPIWIIGPGDPEPAAARFQVGAVRLDYFPASGESFDASRLKAPLMREEMELGNVVELVTIQISETAVQLGKALPLTLYWRALTTPDTSYTFFVQVIDEQGGKAGQVDNLPCDGGCPTTSWRPGDLIGEWYEISIRADAPPGRYQIIVGMYNLGTGENLTSQDGQPYLTLGSIQVTP